jgi:protein-tyrosine phosphatase
VNTVLFLCSGNYYRSRYAEMVFNTLAAQSGIRWQATSRALHISGRNVGPISIHAKQGLAERGIELPYEIRFPQELTEQDLQLAKRIVAVKEAEHRSMVAEKFPAWTDRVEFWQIHDIDCAEPAHALPELHDAVVKLHDELHAQQK